VRFSRGDAEHAEKTIEPQRTQRAAEETNTNWFSSAALCVLCGSNAALRD